MDRVKLHVIGISGKKFHGKDTLATALLAGLDSRPNVRGVRRALADGLKEECAGVLSPLLRDSPMFRSLSLSECRQRLLGIFHGTEGGEAKEQHRLFLQYWGTEFRRRLFRQDYWTAQLRSWIHGQQEDLEEQLESCGEGPDCLVVIVPDVRFPDEAQTILDLGGTLVRVYRPGQGTGDSHPSETALDNYPFEHVVENRADPGFQTHMLAEAQRMLHRILG